MFGIIRPEYIGRDDYFGKKETTLGAIFTYYI